MKEIDTLISSAFEVFVEKVDLEIRGVTGEAYEKVQ